MVVGEASIHNIMGGMESTGGVRLHNHKRKLKQRFDIIKKLGQGTYGKVQLGINKETGQEVAIKTIKKCKIETEADLIRIRREIQIMSSVQHPNIIHIYEVFENKEKMVLVMEYAAGGELYDYLSERKVLSEPEARRIFRQISIAVFYCHKHKICHRDLKLENILLDQIGNAKIADFGLSNVFDEQRLLNTFCGSPLYASPEIVKGTPYHGPEVDCWSLGVLLYTLVYGAMPFDGSNFNRLTRQISQSDYFEPKTPSPASPLIKDMLTKCPARRADIEKICSHWWVNEGYEQNCLDIAEDLAAQTPVRLDLLLSLVPQSASADKLVVGDQRPTGQTSNNISSETLVPTRCHSVGSLMELDRNNSGRRVREMVEEEPRSSAAGDSKRKLETTPSMDEAAGLETGGKRKERLRKKDKNEETAPRAHRFTSNRHHSAPIANPITEEAMEVDPSIIDTSKPQLDLRDDETASACLELIKESLSKSPSKERSKTPVVPDQLAVMHQETSPRDVNENVNENVNDAKPMSNKLAGVCDMSPETARSEMVQEAIKVPENALSPDISAARKVETEEKIDAAPTVPNKEEATTQIGFETHYKDPVNEAEQNEAMKDARKMKHKPLSLDSDLLNEVAIPSAKPTERRRSKIFEAAEKFNQFAAGIENEKPKKIFIPGVNVGGAKRAFERKTSLGSISVPPTVKQSASKVIIDVPNEKKNDKTEEKSSAATNSSSEFQDENQKRQEEKKRAVDIITGAIGKPPVQKKVNGSPPITPQSPESKKLGLKIQVGPNDMRSATVSISTPVDTKFPFETKPVAFEKSVSNTPESQSLDNSYVDEPTMSSKMEITLKSATLPRPRKTSKAEIILSGIKSPEGAAFKSEVEATIDAFHPQKLRTQRSEVAFPVAAVVPQANRSSSLEPEGVPKIPPKERIIPIQVESDHQHQRQTSTPPPKPPMPQRSMSQRSSSLSRQSTADSDTDSAVGSTVGPEPIRKSPREYIIPIAVEGGGYVTPRSGSVEPESKSSTPTSMNPPRSRFSRPRRMSSLLSDASEDESPFSTLHRDSDDLLQRHMHRLRSSRPTRQPPEHTDSLSSGEDDDDDGFELLTAENLFSTLLSRVRSLTQRLNVDDNRGSGFPSSRLLGRLGSNSSQGFWGLHEPLSRRLAESPFRRSMNRETDRFGKTDSAVPSNSATPSSPGTRSTPSRESVFEMGSSNTLPRDRKMREDSDTSGITSDSLRVMKDAQESLEQSFTPSLARRLSRQFIEHTRQSLPRSPSIPREKLYRSTTDESTENINDNEKNRQFSSSTISDQTEYRGRSCDRRVRRTNSLLENNDETDRFEQRSPRRSVSLFDDEDETLPPFPHQVMTLGRKYGDNAKPGPSGVLRRDSLHNYRTEKIQEEPLDEFSNSPKVTNVRSNLASTSDCTFANNSNTNLGDTGSSLSVRSCDDSPTESSSNHGDCTVTPYKTDASRDFENRLLAAENLIKESKLRNLGHGKFDPNLMSSYKQTDKCDKALLASMTDVASDTGKRRSCIPSLRLRSGSLTREASASGERRKTLSCWQDAVGSPHESTPERSILSKFFRAGSGGRDQDTNEKSPKEKGPRRISRFLRPDFFDTPREESRYVKEKEAQKAAENERRKSRFTRKRNDVNAQKDMLGQDEKPEKELKNEANSITRDKTESLPKDNKSESDPSIASSQNFETAKFERQSSKSNFLQSLEKKLEKFRSSDDGSKLTNGNAVPVDDKPRENSAPPVNGLENEAGPIKRAVSVEQLPICDAASPSTASKRRVSSVLGLFKSDSSKISFAGQRPQSTILSKFKRNPYKGSRSDSVLGTEQILSTSSASKIPTKFAKTEVKSSKKISENKKSPEKFTAERIKSPSTEVSKERSPPDKSSSKKFGSADKQTKPPKKISPEKSIEGKTDKREKSSSSKEETQRQSITPEKLTDNRSSIVSRLAILKKSSPEKTTDNKQTEVKSGEAEDKKVVKVKRNVKSLTSLVKNGSVKKLEKPENGEKKSKKVAKPKESTDKDTTDGPRKKIVRVVKKTVKKSDSSHSKLDEKEKTTKTLMKKINTGAEKDTSLKSIGKGKDQGSECSSGSKEKSSDTKICATVVKPNDTNHLTTCTVSNVDDTSITQTAVKKSKENYSDSPRSEVVLSIQSSEAPESRSNGSIRNNVQISDADCKNLPAGLGTAKSNRSNLKLDLSKIPQHSNKGAASKKDYAKIESSSSKPIAAAAKIAPSESPMSSAAIGKVSESLSKITHHANITGNKIVIDKSLCAKDVEDLQRESSGPEVYGNPEKIIVLASCKRGKSDGLEETVNLKSECKKEIDLPSIQARPTNLPLEEATARRSSPPIIKDAINDHTDDMFSPVDDNESFDSWSICSADFNNRHDLHSPTSPTYSPSSRGDHPESIIDRIRRKSFYSRFNERKRKSSLNALPPGITIPASSTLPRKYSFNSSRDKDYRKPSMYASTARRHPERSYSLYNEEPTSYRKSPIERYSDVGSIGSCSGELKSPSDQYDHFGSCYDPLRRYRITPSPDTTSPHRRYQSTDYGLDDDAGSCRSPISPTNRPTEFVNEASFDSYSGRSMLPRKYRTVSSCAEAKSVDYYEELLTPTRSDYLTSRKTPVPGDYLCRHENGYHNENFDIHQLNADKWKSYSEKIAGLDVNDGGDGRLEKQTSCAIGTNNASQDLPASSSEPDVSTSKAE